MLIFDVKKHMARKTAQEMYPLIEQWESSGASQEDFCNSHDITLSTFTYWRGKYRKSSQVEESSFIELHPSCCSSLEVIYPNGVKIRLPQDASASDLQVLIGLI